MSETEKKPLVVGEVVGQADDYASKDAGSPITASRVVNMMMVLLFGISIVCHIVCLAVMVAIHNELVDKFDPKDLDPSNDQWCVLFMGVDYGQTPTTIKFRSNKCHVVIYGSAALACCAFLMSIFLLLRTAICRSTGLASLLDGVEITVTGIFAFVIAIIITVGKNESCDSLEEPYKRAGYSKSCQDIYIGPYRGRVIQVYNALLTAQITSWVAVALLFVMGVVTVIRVLPWVVGRRRGSSPL